MSRKKLPYSDNTIGGRLKSYRKFKAINSLEFSKILGISQGSLSDTETDKRLPPAKSLENISRYTDINIHWLYTGEGQMLRGHVNETDERDGAGASIYEEEDPEITILVSQTREILASDTGYSASLAANIRSFHQAMTTESRLSGVVQDVGTMKNVMNDLVEACNEIKDRLNKSDSNIRKEDPEKKRGEILKKRAI